LLFGTGDEFPNGEALQYASGHDLSGMRLGRRVLVEQLLQLATFEEPKSGEMLERVLIASRE